VFCSILYTHFVFILLLFVSDDVTAMCFLISAVHGEAIIRYTAKADLSLLSRELALLDLALTLPKVTRAQRCWCLKQKSVVQMLLDDMPGTSKTLEQVRD
jgi:hypothetical protein